MRLRLLKRRLTISAPRMAVRSALPWPFRWAAFALVLGFCGAIGLWALEFGKDIAGLDSGAREEIRHLRAEIVSLKSDLVTLRDEKEKAQSIANTAGALVTAEKASHELALVQIKQLETENRTLRDDLGFFEKLIPASGTGGVVIRGLQVERISETRLKWQFLVMQSGKNVPTFNGSLDISFSGTQGGRPWTGSPSDGLMPIKISQYGRMAGEFEVPQQVVVKGVLARVLEGTVVRATQAIKL